MEHRELLRTVFNDDAARYDLTRPRYPAELFDDLAEYAQLGVGSRVFEIGCGTGQATLHMAGLGWAVHAVDVGDKLAAYAATRVRPFRAARVEVASFDEMQLSGPDYAAVAAFTSFHWLDPSTRLGRAASLLAPGGTLAIVDTHHVHGTDPFFDRAAECYVRWDPGAKPGQRLPDPSDIEVDVTEVAGSELFGPIEVRTYPVDILYTRDQYLDLLRTYSDHAALHPESQTGLFGCLAALIDELGGSVRKSYVFSLILARRNPVTATS